MKVGLYPVIPLKMSSDLLTNRKHVFWRTAGSWMLLILLSLLFLLTTFRLLSSAIRFGFETLQVDFSAYYTAGESLRAGLSPYKNNIHHDPPIWDGVDRYKYSRFLYPPLAASFFHLFSFLPYLRAKFLWEFVTLACVVASLILTARLFPLHSMNQILLVGIIVGLYQPLLIHLERGQIDTLTLLLLTSALWLIAKKENRKDILAGVFISAAVLFKLYSLFLLPFIILRKRWKILHGFVVGAVAMLVLTIIAQGGWDHLIDYGYNHLPRIMNFGDIAGSNTLVDKKIIQSILANTPPDYDTIKDGRGYLLGSLDFNANATLIDPVYRRLESKGIYSTVANLSLLSFMVFCIGFWWYGKRIFKPPIAPPDEFIYWQVPLLIILLVSPLTWVMNTVWLLPFSVITISELGSTLRLKRILSIGLIAFGLIFAMIPENSTYFQAIPLWNLFNSQKYVYSELITLAGTLTYLSDQSAGLP